jgi:hypothetical protein
MKCFIAPGRPLRLHAWQWHGPFFRGAIRDDVRWWHMHDDDERPMFTSLYVAVVKVVAVCAAALDAAS